MNIRQTDRPAMSHASSRILQSIFMFTLLAIVKSAHIDLDRRVGIAALTLVQISSFVHNPVNADELLQQFFDGVFLE
jgi:hypothetical protein